MVLHDIISCVISAGVAPWVPPPLPLLCCYSADRMTTLSFNLSSDRRLLLSLPQQTVMQYQLSDDLPSAPPFRLFPTIERDGGGRSECIGAVLTVQVHRGGFCHGPTPVKHMNSVCVCVCCCLWSVFTFTLGSNINTRSEVNLVLALSSLASLFSLPIRLLMYLKLRCELPPKRLVASYCHEWAMFPLVCL